MKFLPKRKRRRHSQSRRRNYRPRLQALEMRRVLTAATNLSFIGGTLFDDFDGDNTVDAGETLIAGAQVRLENTGGGLIRTATTDSGGVYRFDSLTAGDYIVRQPAQTVGNRGLIERVSPTITISAEDVQGTIVTPVDRFETAQVVSATMNDVGLVTNQVLAPEAIGGQRDLVVSNTSGTGEVRLAVEATMDIITFDAISGGDGVRRVIWDGIDADAATVDDTGLDEDLTSNGAALGFNLEMSTDSANEFATVRVYSNDGAGGAAGRFSFAEVPIPVTTDFDIRETAFVAFNTFQTVGGGADFTNVTAIELELAGGRRTNGSAELIGAVGPTEFLQNFDNFDEADLAINKTVDDPTPNVGDTITYSLLVTNNGPNNATNVEVTDLLPDGIDFISSSAGNNYNSTTGVWTVGTIPASQSNQASLTITGRVQSTTFQNNTATITSSDQTDPITQNNTASIGVTPIVIDLEVAKTVDDPSPNTGDPVTFTITVSNTQANDATGVQVRDVLPTGIRIDSPTDVTATSGSYNTANGIWTVGTVAGNDSETLTIEAVVDTPGPRTNSAEVIAANETDFDSTPGDGQGDDFASVDFATTSANLQLTKTVDDTTPNLDGTVNFTVTVSNAGPDTATGVTAKDLLPPGLTFVSSTAGQSYNPATGIWSIGTLASGGSTSLTIEAEVDTVGTKTNVAQIETSDQVDPNSTPGNNAPAEDDQDEISIMPVAIDLSLTKSVNNLSPDVGDTITFQITVANSGPNTATGVQVSDPLPTGTQFISATFPSGQSGVPEYNETTGLWNVGSVEVGSPVTLNLTALVTQAGLSTNFAQIVAADQTDTDSTPGNGDPDEDDQDEASIRPKQIDLELTKTVNNFSPSVGDEIEFVITVNNVGTDVATGVQVTESLPRGVTPIRETPSRGSYNRSRGVWTVGTVGLNDPVTLTIRARVDEIGMGTNSAEVSAADQVDIDSTPNNNVATEDDQASVGFTTETADLSLDKVAVDGNTPNVGDLISFDLTVINDGPDDATGVQVTDLLPSGLTFVSSSLSAGIYNETSGVWSVGDLPAPTERQTLVIGDSINDATSGTLQFVQQNSPVSSIVQLADFESDPLGSTSDALVALGYLPSQFQLRQVSLAENPDGLNIEIRFLGEALEGVDVPRIDLVANLNVAVNTNTIEDEVVDVNSFATLRINAIVDSIDDITNIAEITASGQTDPDSTPGNGNVNEDDRATVDLMPQSADLSLAKTASNLKPNPGDEVTFTLTVSNAGPDAATGVEVTDLLPDGLTFVRGLPADEYDAVTGIWSVGSVGVGADRSLEIVAIANSEVAEINQAEITASDQADPDSTPGNGAADEDDLADVTVTPATADLSIEKSVDDATPNVGATVTFTVTVTNDGPDTATGISIRDQLPGGMTLQSSQTSLGEFNESTGVWMIESLRDNRSATLTLTASVDDVDDKTNVAQVIAADQFDPDSTPANDDDSEDDQDSAALSPELIDLALAKSVDETNPNIGDVVLFEIEVTNDGPSDATGVTVLDQLPEGLTFQASRPSVGGYDANSGIWNLGNVAVGATETLEIEAILETISSAENVAEILAADQPDSDSTPDNGNPDEDDRDSVVLMTQVADLSLEKSVDIATPGRTDEIEFTIRVSNAGPNTATGVVVDDMLPPGLRLISATESSGEYDPETGEWTIPDIVVGQLETLRLVAAVTSADASTNVAEIVQSRQIDPDSTPGNGDTEEDDIASATVTPRVIDIAVSGTIDNDAPLEGDTIQIAFTATNDGSGDASGLEFDAPLPAGLTLLSSQPQTGSYNSNTGRWSVGDLPTGEATRLVLNARVDQRGVKTVPIELVAANEFDIDSTPGNGVETEDDQTSVIVRAPRLITGRLFLSR